MIDMYRYTEKEIKELLKTLTVIVDTRARKFMGN